MDIPCIEAVKEEVKEALPPTLQKLSFSEFALNGKTEELRQQMEDDVYVIGKLAIKGQLTGIFAPPNGGKTLLVLRLLFDAAFQGIIDGSKVFYVNADDNLRGGVDKTSLVEDVGIQMIIPTSEFCLKAILEHQITTGTVAGGIIILDTLKKYADVMNKREQSDFFDLLRQYSAQGGTVIFLGHTNKRREAGELLRAGTDDAHQDGDCDWMLEPKESDSGIIYTFTNTKSRGDVPRKVSYFSSKDTHDSYEGRFHGIRLIDSEEEGDLKTKAKAYDVMDQYSELVDFIKEVIGVGRVTRGDISEAFNTSEIKSLPNVSRVKLTTVLNELVGVLWNFEKDGVTHYYTLINGK